MEGTNVMLTYARLTLPLAAIAATLALAAPANAAPRLDHRAARAEILTLARYIDAPQRPTVGRCVRTSARRISCWTWAESWDGCFYADRYIAQLRRDGTVKATPAVNGRTTDSWGDCGTFDVAPVTGDPAYQPAG